MKPTRCTLLLTIFISTSVHVSGNYVPIIRITYCIYATLVLFRSAWVAVWSGLVWSAGWDEIISHPKQQTRQSPMQSEKYQCHIDAVSSPDDGHIVVSSQPANQTDTHREWKIPVSHRYSKFSWWWQHSCPKHV